MQVFIIGTPLETARALDRKRLNKQIIECQQILDALNGAKAWSNHPCVLQYKGHEFWLKCYLSCLCYVKWGEWEEAKDTSQLADNNRPEWHTQEYFDQMKRRLYEKDEEYYKQWGYLGKSYENWYFVDGEWRIYENGKRIK
jgi:hypothetical protein